MKQRINIAELLKDCPKGMELDCTMYENVKFDYVETEKCHSYPIHCTMTDTAGNINTMVLTECGCNDRHPKAKCVIFPKGKTTWEGFVPPREFKDGDVVVNASNEDSNAFIYAGENNNYYECYVGLTTGTIPELSTDKSFA